MADKESMSKASKLKYISAGKGENIPLGSLESPLTRPKNLQVVFNSEPQATPLATRAVNMLKSAASLVFLPLTVGVALFELIVFLQRKLTGRWRSLEGHVVLITGASSGLGEALAEAFYAQGCRLILCSRRQSELERVRNKLLQSSLRKDEIYPPVILPMDLENTDSLEEKAQTALGIYGRIDILVNNAGISYRGNILETDLSVHQKVMNVNYFGIVRLTQAILPSMAQKQSGHILMIGSVQSMLSIPNRSAYAASKHALQAFTDCLRAEVAANKITVTSVNPGYVNTNISLNAITGTGSKYGIMDETTKNGMTPREAAVQVITAVKTRKEEVLVCPLLHKAAIVLRAIFPTLIFKLLKRRAAKEAKQKLS